MATTKSTANKKVQNQGTQAKSKTTTGAELSAEEIKKAAELKALEDAKVKEEEDKKIADAKKAEEDAKKEKEKATETAKNNNVRKIVFFGDEVEYNPGMQHTYTCPNLKGDYKKNIGGRFPKGESQGIITKDYRGYELTFDSYGGDSVVCKATKDGKLVVENVSVATLIDVLVDQINSTGILLKWGKADQEIKFLRGLKSTVKSLIPKVAETPAQAEVEKAVTDKVAEEADKKIEEIKEEENKKDEEKTN